MQKVVLALLDLHDGHKCQKKAMKIATSIAGIESISLDMKEKKMTIVGKMDPLQVVTKLRKTYRTEIVTVGPAKEPEKPKENPAEVIPILHHYMPYSPYYPNYYNYFSV